MLNPIQIQCCNSICFEALKIFCHFGSESKYYMSHIDYIAVISINIFLGLFFIVFDEEITIKDGLYILSAFFVVSVLVYFFSKMKR